MGRLIYCSATDLGVDRSGRGRAETVAMLCRHSSESKLVPLNSGHAENSPPVDLEALIRPPHQQRHPCTFSAANKKKLFHSGLRSQKKREFETEGQVQA